MGGPVRLLCEVLAHRRAGAYHELSFVAPQIAAGARAGQFVAVLPGAERSLLLRRPFSIHRATRPGEGLGTVDIVLDVVGPGTRALAGVRPPDAIDVVGPLGQAFPLPRDPTRCLLVGGGYGTAPLFMLAEELRLRGCTVDFVIGAATSQRLFKPLEARRLAATVQLTTDDGSAGRAGLVTDVVDERLAEGGTGVVYACGPMAMLAAVARLAAVHGVVCQVAVEEQMACGTGVCFSCVLPVDDGTGCTRMARACYEGPVFAGAAVRWDALAPPVEVASAARAQERIS